MVNKSSHISLHIQIRNELLGDILSGKLETGDRLPSENKLRTRFDVSRTTVRLALADLSRAGFIYTKPGKGTYVASSIIEQSGYRIPGFSESSRKGGTRIICKVLQKEISKPCESIAARIQLNPEEQIIYIKRLRFGNGIPVGLDNAYLPFKLCPEILDIDLEQKSLYDSLRDLDLTPIRAEQMMQVSMPTEEEKGILDLDEGIPVMLIERIAFLSDGKPIEYAKSTYRGDKYHFNMILGRGGDTHFFRGP
ncbi:MAG TPA: GntR family transcriptional regulator [Anaerolineae bacterium]|nr:GntR family transcriptional regulator [Anaerolineae bacterium]